MEKNISEKDFKATSILDDLVMFVLAILSILLLILEETTSLSHLQVKMIHDADFTIAMIFSVEYLVRFIQAPFKFKFFSKTWYELVASIPITNQTYRIFRVLRLFRILKVINPQQSITPSYNIKNAFKQFQYFQEKTRILQIITTAIVLILFASYAFYFFEGNINPKIHSLFDCVWWAMVSVTTIGYGDIYPVTFAGRIIAMLLMIFGIGIVAAISLSIANYYIKYRKRD